MGEKKETVSFIGAAQRLGTSAEAVAELVRDGKLKQIKPGRITLESVYAYSGLNPSGNQTKKSQSRKPNVVDIKDAAALLRVDVAEIKRLVEAGELEICEGAKGTRGVREAMLKMYKKKIDDREEAVAPNDDSRKTKTKEESEEERSSEQKLEETKDAAGGADTAEDTKQDTADDEAGCNNETKPDRESDASGGQESEEAGTFDLDAVMEELFPGIRRLDGFARKAAMAAQKRFTRDDMAEAVDIAFMRGRLSVYDSLHSFERRRK